MQIIKNTSNSLSNTMVDIKIKLAALWLVFMLVYIYTDFYTLYVPGKVDEILSGFKDGMMITQVSLLVIAVITIIPAMMIILCLMINAKVNRWLNIILGILHVAIGVVNLVGATWSYYIYYGVLLIFIALCIVVISWKWPNCSMEEKKS